jgi:hypothetical protein
MSDRHRSVSVWKRVSQPYREYGDGDEDERTSSQPQLKQIPGRTLRFFLGVVGVLHGYAVVEAETETFLWSTLREEREFLVRAMGGVW